MSPRAFKIVTLGVQCPHKGIYNLVAVARIARERGLPFEFVHIGTVQDYPHEVEFPVTGRYPQPALAALIRQHRADAIWFPARWPETFSYSLSTAIDSGVPVVAPEIGAFPERLAGRDGVWTYPWQYDPERLLALFADMREGRGGRPPGAEPDASDARTSARFYTDEYLAWHGEPVANRYQRHPSTPGRRSIVTVESRIGPAQIDACGYVRVHLPLTHPSIARVLEKVSLTPLGALGATPDALLVQRTAVDDAEVARALVAHCKRHEIALIYETDDDLFGIPEDHPEHQEYRKKTAAAKIVAAAASAIVTSTQPLADALAVVNPRTVVLPNALDEQLWFGPATWPERRPPSDDHKRILYMGTATHGADVDIIADTMRRLRTRWDGRITLEIIGAKSAAADWYARLDVPASVAHSYPRFVQWLRAQAKRWVLGVAPLIGSRFNAAKSVLKYLDYAALGLPSILSDVEAYSSLRAQPYARLARNAPAPWYFATSALLRDESLAHKIACGAKGYVRGSHTLGVQATKRRAIWMQLTERPAFHESRKATYA